MPAIRRYTCLALTALVAVWATPAVSAPCAERPVQARGDPSRFEVLAKAKARGNWRAKVRSMPQLGGLYANWNKAANADYRCSEKDGKFVCLAIAQPCRE